MFFSGLCHFVYPEKIGSVLVHNRFYITMIERLQELPLILVSGQARSGTTVLTRAIGAHPQVLSNLRENVWLRDIMAVVVQTHQDPTRVRELSVTKDSFLAEFRDTAYRVLFPKEICEQNPSPRALSTFSSLREDMFEAIPRFLPNYRLVNIVRNGLEVVASRLKHQHISEAGDFETHCFAWAHSLDVVKWFRARPEMKDRFFLVRHEQLLDADSCREVFGRIQHRFGLDRSDACERFVQENFVSRIVAEDQSPQSAQGAQSRKNAWQSWSQEQRAVFERVCGEAMKEFGYEIPW